MVERSAVECKLRVTQAPKPRRKPMMGKGVKRGSSPLHSNNRLVVGSNPTWGVYKIRNLNLNPSGPLV